VLCLLDTTQNGYQEPCEESSNEKYNHVFTGIAAMSSHTEKRTDSRVEFSRAIDAHMVAIDGTWRRACSMLDVAAGGAKLSVTESLEGITLKEFFLVLSSTGLTFRRCELAWINGNQLGVHFLEGRAKEKTRPKPATP
jgi:hypothetical protein